MKQQTAVEWLVLHLNKEEWFTHKQKQTIEQAKAMERQQIINAHWDGRKRQIENSELYYNETFKSE